MSRPVCDKDFRIIWELCGSPQPGQTPARRPGRLGAQQCPRAGIRRGAGRQDIVDQHDAAALDVSHAVGRDLEGALHIGWRAGPATARSAARSPAPAAALRSPLSPRFAGRSRAPARRTGCSGGPSARRQCRGTGTSTSASASSSSSRARHPAAHGRRQIGAVLVFQRMHQRARDIVIAHRGPRAPVGRRIGDRLHRQQFGAGIVDKGNAEPRAVGLSMNDSFAQHSAQTPFAIDRLAAGHALRRQRDVEREFRRVRATRRANGR